MLYDKLKDYSKSGIYPFHMPGHKRADITNEGILPYGIDITEIDGFDNLHNPSGVIKSIQNRAKELYNVKYAFLTVNGATGGILASVRALTDYGDKVLIARNCHKSVYNAVELCGLQAEYILPEIDDKTGIFCSVEPCEIENRLNSDCKIKAVVITSPTYEGVVSDIEKISRICRRNSVMLFVDEAHGAHFPFSDSFPREAVQCGADAAVVSLHKTLPSLTQTALLLTNNDSFAEKAAENLSIFETSSPSYVLISSIDKCLEFIENRRDAFDLYYKNLTSFLIGCEKLKKLDIVSKKGFFDYDKGKIVVSTVNTDISGKDLARILRSEYKIETEMAYANYVIAMTSVCDTKEGFNLLLNALIDIDNRCCARNCEYVPNNFRRNLPEKVFAASDRGKYKEFSTPLESSMGKISLEYVWAYPPGIPIVVPGEIISREIIGNIKFLLGNRIDVYSTNNNLPEKINVTVIDKYQYM